MGFVVGGFCFSLQEFLINENITIKTIFFLKEPRYTMCPKTQTVHLGLDRGRKRYVEDTVADNSNEHNREEDDAMAREYIFRAC